MSVATFSGLLDQNGGVLAPEGGSPGKTTVNGNYDLASAGTVKIEIFAADQYDQLAVDATINLNGDNNAAGGGSLDIDLGYSPTVGTQFTVSATMTLMRSREASRAWPKRFDVAYGSQTVTFQINYTGGTGNDVVLTVTNIAGVAPAGLTVTGTAASELLSGSVGADTITGLSGNDVLTGGAGNDLFVFGAGFGSDRIMDFDAGSDDIPLSSALGVTSFDDLDTNTNGVLDGQDAHVSIAGADTIIHIGSDQIDVVGQRDWSAAILCLFEAGVVLESSGITPTTVMRAARAVFRQHGDSHAGVPSLGTLKPRLITGSKQAAIFVMDVYRGARVGVTRSYLPGSVRRATGMQA